MASSPRPERLTVITASAAPTQVGSPRARQVSTGAGQDTPARPASRSPVIPEVPSPATTTARGRPSSARRCSPASRHSAIASRTWAPPEATSGSIPEGSRGGEGGRVVEAVLGDPSQPFGSGLRASSTSSAGTPSLIG